MGFWAGATITRLRTGLLEPTRFLLEACETKLLWGCYCWWDILLTLLRKISEVSLHEDIMRSGSEGDKTPSVLGNLPGGVLARGYRVCTEKASVTVVVYCCLEHYAHTSLESLRGFTLIRQF